jgi:hypothetical protein
MSRIFTSCTKEAKRWGFTCRYFRIGKSKTSSLVLMQNPRNAIAGGNTLGPLICGFVVQGLGWRWQKWIAVILTGTCATLFLYYIFANGDMVAVNFLAVLLFVPETRYGRGDSSGSQVQGDVEKTMSSGVGPFQRVYNDGYAQLPKKTFFQGLALWSRAPSTNLFKMFVRPFPMIIYPSVIYAFLCYSISLVLVVAVNILNPFTLQAPPYSWKPQINGLINIPGILGNLFGAWVGGKSVSLSFSPLLTGYRRPDGYVVCLAYKKEPWHL